MEENNNRREDGKRPRRPRKVYSTINSNSSEPHEGRDASSDRTSHSRPTGGRPYKKNYGERPDRRSGDSNRYAHSNRPSNGEDSTKKSFSRDGDSRPASGSSYEGKKRNFSGKSSYRHDGDRPQRSNRPSAKGGKPRRERKVVIPPTAMPNPANEGTTRLNKYIANAGICSRREADKLIAAGAVSVNGVVVTEMGFKVRPGDVVNYGGERLSSEAKRYFLLNKPKGFITTLDDPQERHTVMELVENACKERIYPVGRLDRDTTGLLLFTNDGEMAKKLTHPSTGVYKIYQVELNRPVTREDMRAMLEGVELEDGPIALDDVQYVEQSDDKRIVGVELHSGRNRIVRRVFEHFGYEVHKLDRTVFAGLTKKDLPRGHYRELTAKEISFLKMI